MLGIDQRAARYTWTAALVLILLYLAYLVRSTLFVLTVSLLFAYLLYPLVDLLNRYIPNRSRTPALAIVYLVLVGLMVLLFVEVGSEAVDQATALSQRAPALLERLRQQPTSTALPSSVQSIKQTAINSVEGYVYKHYNEFVSMLPQVTLKILKASSDLIYLIIVPILSFFLLKDGRQMRDEMVELVEPGRTRQMVLEIFSDIHTLLLQYMRALFVLCMITFTVFAIVLSLLGVPYSILLASVAFPLEFIPLVGPLVAAGTIIAVSAFSGYPHVLWVIIFLAAYRMAQDYIISPRLMSSGIELHPVLVILGVFGGGEIGGVAGTFLSIPVMALLRVLYRRTRKSRLTDQEPVVIS